jgi:hypothetical protein
MPVAIEFDAGAHTYRLNGRAVPGVTSVLEPLQMLDGIPWEVLEHARVRGQHVHEACHLHNLGGLEWDSLEDEVAGYVRGYLKFLAESSFVVLASETRVGSPKYGFCGTLDLYGLLKGPTQIDIKTTATLPRTVGPQTAAYKQAHEETTGQKTKRRSCLHLKADGTYRLVELTDGKGVQDFTVFLSALNLHRWRCGA